MDLGAVGDGAVGDGAVTCRPVAVDGGTQRGVELLQLPDAAIVLPGPPLEALLLFLELGRVLRGDHGPHRLKPCLMLRVLVRLSLGEALVGPPDEDLMAGTSASWLAMVCVRFPS